MLAYRQDHAGFRVVRHQLAPVAARRPVDGRAVAVEDGFWEPICAFLGRPVPAVAFPHTNTTQDLQARISSYANPAAGGR